MFYPMLIHHVVRLFIFVLSFTNIASLCKVFICYSCLVSYAVSTFILFFIYFIVTIKHFSGHLFFFIYIQSSLGLCCLFIYIATAYQLFPVSVLAFYIPDSSRMYMPACSLKFFYLFASTLVSYS